MLKRFSEDIAKGEICRASEQGRFEKTVIWPSAECHSGGGNVARRYPNGYLLKSANPLDGRHPRER